ncbi:MAG: inorganic phosphate transporter [Methanomassiliicoccales archaeon]|nr:inorganic phosphate transporter [Methanomassiliicoccales archaeon]
MAVEQFLYLGSTVIAIALLFDFTNGFHDSANAIATVVSTKVLSPGKAVAMAAILNFLAALVGIVGSVSVAATMTKILHLENFGYAQAHTVLIVMMAGVLAAIIWNIITWLLGLPTSSSHALIGGIIGAGMVSAGLGAVQWPTLLQIVIFMIVSPLIGMLFGFLLMTGMLWLVRKRTPQIINNYFKRLQLLSAALFSFSHGLNDAQKTMGIIATTLWCMGWYGAAADPKHLQIEIFVIIGAHIAIALGTLMGGWRIVKTMGSKITRLDPIHGFCAETAGAGAIIGTSLMGIPISTTHVISTSIIGVGATRRISAVRWGVARSIAWAWLLTIPCAALVGALIYYGAAAFL